MDLAKDMQNLPVLHFQDVLKLFQDHISIEQPNPARQLFHSSVLTEVEHDFFSFKAENITLRPEFTLNICRFLVKEPFLMEVFFPLETIGFTFPLEGDAIFHIPFFKHPVPFPENSFSIFRCSPHMGMQEFRSGPFTSINIHYSKKAFVDLISAYNQAYEEQLSPLFSGDYYLK